MLNLRFRRNGLLFAASLMLHLQLPVVSHGQDADAIAEMRAAMLEIPSRYEITGSEQDVPFTLLPEPIKNWTNPLRQTVVGTMFLWTHNDRPQAVLSVFPDSTHLLHELLSLSPTKIAARSGGRIVWEPTKPGIVFQTLSDVSNPGPRRRQRLAQMRTIANGFQAELKPTKGPQRPLRLIRAPTYRYPEGNRKDNVIDGAMFMFALADDPEALVIIEAIADDIGKLRWQYGFARVSMVPMRVERGGEEVWRVNWATIKKRHSTYFIIRGEERDDAEIISFD